jgi:hypothetical protein
MMTNAIAKHQHTPEEERSIREAALDRTVEGSFPASDPPSSNPNPYDRETFELDARPESEASEQIPVPRP